MTENTRIKYIFHNKDGEIIEMSFTMLQIECMNGGFREFITKELNDMGFGKPIEIYRMLLI